MSGLRPTLCLVLHAHLPWVRHEEYDDFLEERWLFEALTESYLPLLRVLDRLAEEDVPSRIAVSLSPTLLEMWADPLLQQRYERHASAHLALAEREEARLRPDARFHPVARHYAERWRDLLAYWREICGRDPATRFRALADAGRIECLTTAATHAYLPLFRDEPAAVRAQLAVGAARFRRPFSTDPAGLWLPECAYYPGLEYEAARTGARYFITDAAALLHADAKPQYGFFAPVACPNGMAVFARDPECVRRVWDARQGYPGHPDYREFYRDIGPELSAEALGDAAPPAGARADTGLKYWRVTGPGAEKQPYRRATALARTREHAEDFIAEALRRGRLAQSAMDRAAILTAPFDAELFGHWWYEGPEWLEAVARQAPAAGLDLRTPSEALAARPHLQVVTPAESSWGAGGAHEPWLTPENQWMRDGALSAALRLALLQKEADHPRWERALRQAARHVLLAMASDWPFMLANRTAPDFATRTARDQQARFSALEAAIRSGRDDPRLLQALEQLDPVFPDLDLRAFAMGKIAGP